MQIHSMTLDDDFIAELRAKAIAEGAPAAVIDRLDEWRDVADRADEVVRLDEMIESVDDLTRALTALVKAVEAHNGQPDSGLACHNLNEAVREAKLVLAAHGAELRQ